MARRLTSHPAISNNLFAGTSRPLVRCLILPKTASSCLLISPRPTLSSAVRDPRLRCQSCKEEFCTENRNYNHTKLKGNVAGGSLVTALLAGGRRAGNETSWRAHTAAAPMLIPAILGRSLLSMVRPTPQAATTMDEGSGSS
jgi:hypothetical protein